MALCTGKGGYQCPFAPETRLSKSAATTSNWEIRVFMNSVLNPLPPPASPPNAMSGVPTSRTRHGGRKEITKFSAVAYVYFLLSLILGQCFLKDHTWGSFLNRHWSSSWKWRFWASTQDALIQNFRGCVSPWICIWNQALQMIFMCMQALGNQCPPRKAKSYGSPHLSTAATNHDYSPFIQQRCVTNDYMAGTMVSKTQSTCSHRVTGLARGNRW